jgi:glycosyltransferase involved in cell wall biosynthesis
MEALRAGARALTARTRTMLQGGAPATTLRPRTLTRPGGRAASTPDTLPALDGATLAGLAARVDVVILTKNEAARIERCIRALPAGINVHVLDSGSTDDTVRIATTLGGQVSVRDWQGFAAQRNFALDHCGSHPWVLFIDADETYPISAWTEIAERTNEAMFDAFAVPSMLVYEGRMLMHAPGYPLLHVRLVHRDKVQFAPSTTGHGEALVGSPRVGTMRCFYIHDWFDGDVDGWLRKNLALALAEAGAAAPANVRETARARTSARVGNGPHRPLVRFVYHWLLVGGWRDGWRGFEYALLYCWYELTRYVSWSARRRRERVRDSARTDETPPD